MTEPRKRVLMVCYYYPPIHAVGTNRSLGFSKKLVDLGWDVTVLTVKDCKDPWTPGRGGDVPPGVNVVRASEFNLSRIVDFLHGALSRVLGLLRVDLKTNYFREIFCLPDTQVAWMFFIKLLSEAHKNDVVYVSCSPFSAAVKAAIAKVFHGKRLIVDFRDAWSVNPYIRHIPFHQFAIGVLEKFVFHMSDRVILNSPGAESLYRNHYPSISGKFVNIPNGYDQLNEAPAVVMNPFSIVHVGNFYGERSPRRLLEALAEIGDPSIQFVQVGGAIPDYEEFKERVNIKLIPPVSSGEALELMKRASLLYLKQGAEVGVHYHIAVAAKTYEYLSTGIPILADLPLGDNLELVRKYANPESIIVEPEPSFRLANSLRDYRKQEPKISVNSEFIRNYNRSELASALNDVLTSAC